MPTTTIRNRKLEELDYREADGIAVSLVWDRMQDRLLVVVDDGRTEQSFVVAVDGDSPLDVFHHPYAYAAFRGVAVT